MEGRIVKLVRHRGFGFIDAEEFDDDVFFHHSGLENVYFEDLSIGDELEFEVNHTDKGPEAKKIEKVGLTENSDESESEESIENHLGW